MKKRERRPPTIRQALAAADTVMRFRDMLPDRLAAQKLTMLKTARYLTDAARVWLGEPKRTG